MTSLPKVVFHVGAHKTATTHLQRSLAVQRQALWDQGVRVLLPIHLRGEGQRLEDRFDLPINRTVLDPGADPRKARAHLSGNAHRIVISEENFVGGLLTRTRRLRMPLYPEAVRRLNMLLPVLSPERDVDICLGIRDPASFLNSAYSQLLIKGRLISVTKFKISNPLRDVDWVDLIARLRSIDGVGAVTVWRQEDYPVLFPRICRTLVGPLGSSIASVTEPVHHGLSASAVQHAFDRAADGASGPLAALARDAFPVGEGSAAYDGFTAEERALSAEYYAQQTALIAAMPGVTLMSV